jgi:hypothetical protein
MTFKHINEYGAPEIAKATIAKLFLQAELTEVDKRIIYLRFGCDWHYADIAKEIGEKFYNRSPENPMWEGTIRYRVKIIMKTLRKMLKESDFIDENP